jgi:hypothetical protein
VLTARYRKAHSDSDNCSSCRPTRCSAGAPRPRHTDRVLPLLEKKRVALAAAHDLGIHDLCIVGLAKEKENELGERMVDRVYLPGQKNPIPLRPNSPELFMLALARDEAHRFSNAGRRRKGKRRRFESVLDRVRGIGPKTKTALLKELGPLRRFAPRRTTGSSPFPGSLGGIWTRCGAGLRRARTDNPGWRAGRRMPTRLAHQVPGSSRFREPLPGTRLALTVYRVDPYALGASKEFQAHDALEILGPFVARESPSLPR